MNNGSTTRRLLKNCLSIGVGTVFSKLLAFFMIPLYSIWLTTDEYGTYDLISTYVSLFVPFATLQLEQALFRSVSEYPEKAKKDFSAVAVFVFPLLLCVAAVLYSAIRFCLGLPYGIHFAAFFISFALFNLTTEYARGLKRLRLYSMSNIIAGVSTAFLATVLVGFNSYGVEGMLLSYSCSYMLVAIALLFYFRPFCLVPHPLQTIKEMLKFSLPLIPNSVSWWIANLSNRSFVNLFLGASANGLFAVACKIPTMVSLLFSVFNLAFQQTAIEIYSKSKSSDYFRETAKHLTVFLFSGSLAIGAALPLLYRSVLSPSYWEGIYCIPVLLSATVLLSIAQYFGGILLASRRTKTIGLSTVAASVVSVALNVSLIPIFGLNGASIATFFAYLVMYLLRLVSLKEMLPVEELLVKTIASQVVLIALCYCFIFSYDCVFIYALEVGCVFVVVLFANRAILGRLMERMKRHEK